MKSVVRRAVIIPGLVIALVMSMGGTAFAAAETPRVSYSIEMDDSAIDGAAHISSESYVEDGRLVEVDVYQQADGTIITDTFERSATALYSAEGSDTATRTRTIDQWGSITLTASFRWYTEGLFSYVKCTSMRATRNLDSKAVVSTWETDYTKDYVSIGTAQASVSYYMYNREVPVQHQSGTFKITCTDEGVISDNG